MHPHEAVWVFYVASVVAVDLVFGAGSAEGRPLLHAIVHLILLALVLAGPRLCRTDTTRTTYRAAMTLVGLPIVFTSLAWVLPALHPEPYEWTWIASDRALFGGDPTAMAGRLLTPAVTEVLQVVYSLFYFVPMAAVILAGRRSGRAVFERCLVTVQFGFLLSYLGYLLWPTLPPYRFLWHAEPLKGLWLTDRIHHLLDAAELHQWDCFPSGHTMLSVISMVVVVRHAPRAAWWFVPLA